MRDSRRGATVLAWACVATAAGILASPAAHLVHRRYNSLQVMAQSLVHWAGLLAGPPALVAARTRNRRLGLAAGGVGVAGLATAAWIAGRPEVATSAPVVTVAHFNLLYLNDRLALDLAAIAATGADVLTFSEVTPRHLATLQHSALASHYPYRVERPGPYATGTALWSRVPVRTVDGPVVEHHTVAADVDLGPSGPVRVIVIHTRSPLHHYGEWADNRAKLLAELAGATDRRARFRTVAMIVWPDGRELAVEGVCDGTIPNEERGARGFGYDAVFRPVDGDGRTFAEMSEREKSALSHRGRAFRGLLSVLADGGRR